MNICMVVYAFYETDMRVMMYAKSLKKRGDNVDVIALRREGDSSFEILDGINVYRIQKRRVNEKGKFTYLFKLLMFFINSSLLLIKKSLKQPYHLIHVHSVPDFEVFSALVPKLRGSKIILDIHDIVPEFYASKFGVSKDSFVFKSLKLVEKASVGFADHVIIANHIWEKTLTSRSTRKEKCTTILSYPDTSIFHSRMRTRKDDNLIVIYPGTINWHQGLDIAVKAFAQIKDEVPNAEFHIYGDGPMTAAVQRLIADLDVQDRIFIKEKLATAQIAYIMANADLGVVPKRNDSFGGDAFSTKILEFMALGVPIIVAATRIDRYYFNDNVVRFFEPENEMDLALNMKELIRSKEQRERLSKNAMAYVTDYTWDKKEKDYLSLVDKIVGQKVG